MLSTDRNEVEKQYMKERVMLMDAREEGREEEATERILDMLRRGKTVDEIVDFCGYEKTLVEEIKKEMLVASK